MRESNNSERRVKTVEVGVAAAGFTREVIEGRYEVEDSSTTAAAFLTAA